MQSEPIRTILADNVPGLRLLGRVLLLEPKQEVRRLLGLYLENMGVEVLFAEAGETALELARDFPFDLVMLGAQSTAVAGLDVIRQLRQRGYPQPVVVLAEELTQALGDLSHQFDHIDLLTKPVTPERLYHCMGQYLARPDTAAVVTPLYSELSGEDAELAEIIDQFISRLPELIASIDDAYRHGDWVKFGEAVHNLKGIGGGYGFPMLTELAAEIETLLEHGGFPTIEAILESLRHLTVRILAGQVQTVVGNERNVG